jgi:hypothetical protein
VEISVEKEKQREFVSKNDRENAIIRRRLRVNTEEKIDKEMDRKSESRMGQKNTNGGERKRDLRRGGRGGKDRRKGRRGIGGKFRQISMDKDKGRDFPQKPLGYRLA